MNKSTSSSFLRPASTSPKVLAASVATLIGVCVFSPSAVRAAIVVGGGAGVTETFDTLPPVENWSTTNVAGGAGDVVDPAGMDGAVGALTANPAAGLGTALLETPTPGGAGAQALGRYNSVDLLASSRPTGVRLTPILASLENGTGGAVDRLNLAFDLGTYAPIPESPGLDGYRVYFSLDGASWTPVEAVSGIGTAGRLSTTVPLGAPVASGAPLFVLWADDNGPSSPDTGFTLDNVTFSLEAALPPGANLVYNLAHTVGGAPNGNFDLSGGQYFLNGANPAAFANNDVVNFSQNGTATIGVPVDIAPNATHVTASTGTYTIGGAGKISGSLTKENAGTLVLTSDNSFTSAAFSGGTIATQALNALGTGPLSVDGTGGTLRTEADLSVAGLKGTGPLTKTGAGALALSGNGNATGGLLVQEGMLQLATSGGVGGPNQTVTLGSGLTLQSINTAGDVVFSDANNPRTLVITGNGATISTLNGPGSVGLVFGGAESLQGSAPITKTGDGALRLRGEHSALTSNWIINGGTLEYGAGLVNGIGSGTVTVNAGGRFGVQSLGTTVPTVATNAVTLNGGSLGARTGDYAEFGGNVNVAASSAVDLFSFSTPANALSVTVSGILSGSGDLVLNGVAGATAASTKALILTNSGNTYNGAITVSAGAGLAGTGTTRGAVNVNALGTLGAGSTRPDPALVPPAPTAFGAGILSIGGNLTLAQEAVFNVDLAGSDPMPVAGTDYDRIAVGTGTGANSTGQVDLGGSILSLRLGLGIEENDLFFIMTNDGIDPVIGTFGGLLDAQEFTITDPVNGDQIFRISYNADEGTNAFDSVSGNDIALIAVPEPGSAALLALGSALLLRRRRMA